MVLLEDAEDITLEKAVDIKLMTHNLIPREGASNTRLWNCSLETLFAAEILCASQTHTNYRFFICDDTHVILQLLLINWNTQINANVLDFSGQDMIPVLKILFTECSEVFKSQEDWIAGEKLFYSSEECLQLKTYLLQSNSALPPLRRSFGGMKVGFLRQIL